MEAEASVDPTGAGSEAAGGGEPTGGEGPAPGHCRGEEEEEEAPLREAAIQAYREAFQQQNSEPVSENTIIELGKAKAKWEKRFNRRKAELSEVEQRIQQLQEQIERDRHAHRARQLDQDLKDFLSSWLNIALRVMMELRDFKEDPVWISEHLLPGAGPEQVSLSLALLERLGLSRRVQGRLYPTDAILRTPSDVADFESSAFHQQMLEFGLQALLQLPKTDAQEQRRHRYQGVTVAVSPDQLGRIKTVLKRAEDEILAITAEDPDGGSPRDRLYYAMLCLLPLSRFVKGS